MSYIDDKLKNVKRAALIGHVHSDGDSVGSVLGLRNYILDNYPEIEVRSYLDSPQECFSCLSGFSASELSAPVKPWEADLAVALDVSDHGRLADGGLVFDAAGHTLNIDHHVSNPGFAEETVLEGNASSACEVLYGLLDPEKVSRQCAECLYTGIVTDSGVFKYSSTSARTMRFAGELMEKGIDFGEIIDRSFYRKSYYQNQIMGRALLESILVFDGKCIVSKLSRQDLRNFSVTPKDLDGIVEQLRLTEGVECAVFLYETDASEWKVSLRSVRVVDVSAIAGRFGGGGHIRAAGFTANGNAHDIINAVLEEVERGLVRQVETC